jgi:hypothetical protein
MQILVRFLAPLLVPLTLLQVLCLAQQVRFPYHALPREIIEQRLRRVSNDNAKREADLRAMFEESGCSGERLSEQEVERKRPPNLACVLAGATNSTIVVGAHSDHVKAGQGAVDDWSGAALLPSLLESLQGSLHRHTFVFVGFTEEEQRMVGSRFYVKHLSNAETASIRAMVNLECLGLAPTEVWAHHADRKLLAALLGVAQSTNVQIQAVNVEKVGRDDSEPFVRRKVPTLTIHSLTQDTLRILHSREDQLSAINLDYYYETYRLIAAYLAYLDVALE